MAYVPSYYPGYPIYSAQPQADTLGAYRPPSLIAQNQYATAAPAQNAPMPADDRLLVQGIEAATSWPVTANGFVRLWDSTAPVFYEKRADAQGKPLPLEVYDYKRREEGPPAIAPSPNYEDRLKHIEERLAAMEQTRTDGKQKEGAQ